MTVSQASTVSVVIPAYNHADFLEGAIASVLGQSHAQIELIVVNDGSTDATAETLDALEQRFADSRFKVIHQENAGQAKALEAGWNAASGAVLGYLSADDLLDKTAAADSLAALQGAPDAVATYCDYRLIDQAGRIIRNVAAPAYDYEHMLCDVICLPGPGAFFTRDAYRETGAWDPNYRQMPDYDFWLRMGLLGDFVHISKTLASFRIHEGSQTYSRTTPERAQEPIRIIEGLFKHPNLNASLRALQDRALSSAHLVSAQLHFRAGRLQAGMRTAGIALRLAPRLLVKPHFYRSLVNAMTNRIGHRILWTLRAVIPGGRAQ